MYKWKNKGTKIITISLVSSLLLILASTSTTSIMILQEVKENIYPSYIPHSEIYIDSDDDFGPTGYNFPGDGSLVTPYVIDGYSIETSASYGINITSTSVYFIISNCLITTTGTAISITNTNTETATVFNNICNDNSWNGIYIKNSDLCVVANNTCSNNGPSVYMNSGIYIESSTSSIVANNTCNNNQVGIYVAYSSLAIIMNNSCSQNEELGIYLPAVPDSLIENNYCKDAGIRAIYSSNTKVLDNEMVNCGYSTSPFESDYSSYVVENNSVNGKPLGYITDENDKVYDNPGFGQVIIASCTNIVLKNCEIKNVKIGICVFYCSYTNFTNVSSHDNDENGIYMVNSNNCRIEECNLSDNQQYGAELYLVEGIFVSNNIIERNDFSGMMVSTSTLITVFKNRMKFNNIGIYLASTSHVNYQNNTCSDNDYGMIIDSSDYCLISFNEFKANEDYAIQINSGSNFNIIHHNSFIANNEYGLDTCQACDNAANNVWYDTATNEGNFWADWDGSGSYPIDGTAGSSDLYPLGSSPVPEFDKISFLTLLSLIPIFVVTIVRKKSK